MYTNSDITRDNPSCFLFLVDQSSSMAEKFGDRGNNQTKAEGVALALNNLLRNLIITCSKADGIRNYFDVGVIGYGLSVGPAWSGSLAGRELVPIRDVADNFARMTERVTLTTDPLTGATTERKTRIPLWVEPKSGGSTPMCEALGVAHRILSYWLSRNPSSFPPVVVHITDGEATDGNPAPYMKALTELGTMNGKITLFNVHLSGSRVAQPTSFPDSTGELNSLFARMLFEQASVLTPFMRSVAWNNGLTPTDTARAFVLNADPTLMVLALEIGTRAGNMF